jgi:hypothetical protein
MLKSCTFSQEGMPFERTRHKLHALNANMAAIAFGEKEKI